MDNDSWGALFERFARRVGKEAGSWQAFTLALSLVFIWFCAGFYYGFDNQLYQLVINTGTTIITFLMVFLLQSSQNRDTLAIQLKIDELIFATKNASNKLVRIEDLTESELRTLLDRRERRKSNE